MKHVRNFFFLILTFTSQFLCAQASPLPMLQNGADQIIATLKANQGQLDQRHDVIYQAVERYLLPHVDVEGMSRSVLGRTAWMRASAEERAEFSKEFTRLVIRTYAGPLAKYQGETIRFLPIRGNLESRFIRANSQIIRSNGSNILLSYSLVATGNEWKIYDLTVEGVSLLQSFRTQFSQVLQNGNMQTLLKQMNERSQAFHHG